MTEKTDAEVFTEAADLIEAHGHLQAEFGKPGVGFCVAGAVYYALTGHPRGEHVTLPLDPARARYVALLAIIRDTLPYSFSAQGTQGVTQWNDVAGRTQAEAVALLRGLARNR